MKAASRAAPLWFRLFALGLGILLLFWLPVEDLDQRWVILFAAAFSALAAALYLSKSNPAKTSSFQEKKSWLVFALVGALAGLAVPLLATLLMIFKIGLHGHPSPDFTPGQILAVFYRTPVFILAGLFISLGIWFYKKTV